MSIPPSISIIVPAYGVEGFLPKCIESLINQTYKNIEIILVDDGSKDCSGQICDEYADKDNRIVVIHKENGGLSSARNAGLEVASGEWIMHVDGDDWIEPQMVELLYKQAVKANADIVFTDCWYDYPNRSIASKFYDWDKQGEDGLNRYISSGMTCIWGNLIKKNLYDNYNLQSPNGVTCCEDFHLIVRLCFFAQKISKVREPLYHYSQRDTSILHNLSKKTEREEQWVYADIIRFFKEHDVYDDFKRVMAWRTLKASQEQALDVDTFDEFCSYNPDKKDYILDCPFLGIKMKIITWCLTHGLRLLATSIIKTRGLLSR